MPTQINLVDDSTTSIDALQETAILVDGNEATQQLIPECSVTFASLDNDILTASTNIGEIRLLQSDEDYQSPDLALRLTSNLVDNKIDLQGATWINAPTLSTTNEVLESLKDAFSLIEDNPNEGSKGLRRPQLGALHAVLGYWTVENHAPATVVLPTGTGKTETMLSLFAKERTKKLLVLVPSDALRTQISKKFESFGILQEFGIVASTAKRPIVGIVKHKFTNSVAAKGFAEACNVIVTTPQALLESDRSAWLALVKECTHLFVDEAHHSVAYTWNQIISEFIAKYVVQFTATPYRYDGTVMKGKIIYNFPLKKAQEQGYFSKINYESVFALGETDKLIAEKAVEYLRKDIAAGHQHIMMARAKTKKKAEKLLATYKEVASDLKPVYVHSTMKQAEKKAAIQALNEQSSKVLICVDMFGEGFDMPSLKIAAIHEPHRSLGVTLQFIGRFARVSGTNLGDATMVVNRGDPQEDIGLRKLYAENPDWNLIINELADGAVGEQEDINEFENGFAQLPVEISLRNLEPKMSTVVYRTNTINWHPEKITDFFGPLLYTEPIAINEEDHVTWFVTCQPTSIGWGNVKAIEDTTYNLFICYWDKDNKLLYINGSSNSGSYEELAKLLCEDSVELIKDLDVYKTMATLKRRIPTNVGLKDMLTNIFQMNMGSSVAESLTGPGMKNKFQTNIFAHGFDESDGAKIGIGASLKGRIWSNRSATSLKRWTEWCDFVGGKLLDDTIKVDDILKGFIIPEPCESRPELIPLLLEWPSDMYMNTSEYTSISINGDSSALIDSEMAITDFKTSGPIPFVLRIEENEAKYELTIVNKKMEIKAIGTEAIVITNKERIPFSQYITKEGIRVQFEQQTVLEPEMVLLKINTDLASYDKSKLVAIDWEGINIRKESQGKERDQTTIQARAVNYLKGLESWDVIIDDDGSGEIADLVAIKLEGGRLKVNLVHCKFSKDDSPGARVGDFYEVCGQAQKSIQRRRQPYNMVKNLIRRERKRQADGGDNILVGTGDDLQRIAENIQLYLIDFTVTIVQPGLSKAVVSDNILELLAATESYISDVGGRAPLRVVVSE